MTPLRRHSDAPAQPMRRREDELEELLEHGSRNFRRYRRRAYLAFAILAVASAVALVWVGKTAERAGSLAREVQSQRVEAIRSNCEAQNRRHDETIVTLDRLVASLPDGPRKERAKAGRKGTVLLIEALQPRQDCVALVRRAAPTP